MKCKYKIIVLIISTGIILLTRTQTKEADYCFIPAQNGLQVNKSRSQRLNNARGLLNCRFLVRSKTSLLCHQIRNCLSTGQMFPTGFPIIVSEHPSAGKEECSKQLRWKGRKCCWSLWGFWSLYVSLSLKQLR